MSALLPYEFAYPWSKRLPNGAPENHTLNAAILRLFKGSAANLDMITRVANEHIPFGLWGLSALRDDTKHEDLQIVDVRKFDTLWKYSDYFSPEERKVLLKDETTPETAVGSRTRSNRRDS